MTRRLWVIPVLGASAAVAAATAIGAGTGVKLAVPPAQSVAVVAAKLSGPASALRLDGKAPARSTAFVAVKGNALLAVVVNRSGGAGAVLLAGARAAKTKSIPDAGRASPVAMRGFAHGLKSFLGWDPLNKPDELARAGVTVRLFDAAHRAGRSISAQQAQAVAGALDQLLIAPNISVRDEIYKQIDDVSGCILGRVTCGSYVFTFSGLNETVYRADKASYRLVTSYSGRTCGRTLLGQPWRITYRSGGSKPVTRTMNFDKSNIVFRTKGKINGGVGEAIHKLAPITGAFPQMEALVDSTGGWSSNSGGRFVQVLVSRLPAGRHC